MKILKSGLFLTAILAATAMATDFSQPMQLQTPNQQPAQPSIVFNSSGSPISVKSDNPKFTLTLKSNPTTGYSWSLENYDAKFIVPVNHKFIAPSSNLMGAPGHEVWTFKALPAAFDGEKSTTVTMKYARPWEKHVGDKMQFTVEFGK